MSERQPDEVERLLRNRRAAREGGDFERADALREQIRELGWEVQDSVHGSTARPLLPDAPAPDRLRPSRGPGKPARPAAGG